jgi:hypothetical protein
MREPTPASWRPDPRLEPPQPVVHTSSFQDTFRNLGLLLVVSPLCSYGRCTGAVRARVGGARMLVFKVNVEDVDGGYQVICPDVPVVRHKVRSLWDACTVRHMLAEQAGVPDDLVWLQVHARTGAITVISDVHPLHWVAFHSVIRPSHPVFDRSNLVFDHALMALRHEAAHAQEQARSHAQVKFILSFLDESKVSLPRHGSFLLSEVIEQTRTTDDLSAWIKTRLTGLPESQAHWYTPVISLQVGVFGPEAHTARRYR